MKRKHKRWVSRREKRWRVRFARFHAWRFYVDAMTWLDEDCAMNAKEPPSGGP